MTAQLINYTSQFKSQNSHDVGVVCVHGMDRNILILRKLSEPYRRADGKLGRYELEYRWLSVECEHAEDEAWACVQGSEFTFWLVKELKDLPKLIKKEEMSPHELGEINLFNYFNLF